MANAGTNAVYIIVDNYINSVCYPGQTLSGRVECVFEDAKRIRAIRIKFKGRAKTNWTRSQGKSSVKYWAEEIYFNQEYNLVSGGDDFEIAAGRHTYPFSYILPQSLPSSFEGKYGNVAYSIKAVVDRPWMFDYEQKFTLIVYSPLNLNCLPGLENPIAVSADKQVTRGCCGSEPLIFNIYLPVRGFGAGQEMNISAIINNMSNTTVQRVLFTIIQVVQFIADHPRRRERFKEFIVTSCVAAGVGAHAEKTWTTSLKIPALNFPNLIPCSVINTTYRVEAEVVLPFPHRNLKTTFPITIGSVPLTGVDMGRTPLPTNSYPPNCNATAPLVDSMSGFEDAPYLPTVNKTAPKGYVAEK